QNETQIGARFLFLLSTLLSISSYEAVFIIMITHSFISGGLGVFHSFSIVLAAVIIPAMITENAALDMLRNWLLSPNRHNLGDGGMSLPSQLLKLSTTIFQNGLITGHSTTHI